MAVDKNESDLIGEKRLAKVYKRNPALMKEFGISSVGAFIKALGDLYDSETRKALMSVLPEKDRICVKEYYLRNCRAGLDRFPACLKITITWSKGVWKPCNNDYYTEMKVEYDRIKSLVKYSGKTFLGVKYKLQSPLSEAFEDQLFIHGEVARFGDTQDFRAFDSDMVTIICEYADGEVYEINGHPDIPLFQDAQSHFRKLQEQLVDIL